MLFNCFWYARRSKCLLPMKNLHNTMRKSKYIMIITTITEKIKSKNSKRTEQQKQFHSKAFVVFRWLRFLCIYSICKCVEVCVFFSSLKWKLLVCLVIYVLISKCWCKWIIRMSHETYCKYLIWASSEWKTKKHIIV